MLFTEMGLSPKIQEGVSSLGFTTATPIQEQVIPVLLSKQCDLIGLAQTGTGKTAAYGLPILENIQVNQNFPQVLILSPTRELCVQITKDMDSYGKYIDGVNTVAVYGGAPIEKQIAALKRGVQIVIATPGRIYDLVRRKRIDLSRINTLVLDEADEMLKMGFRDDLDAILEQTPINKNTWLFSATMSPEILNITKNYMEKPVKITIGKTNEGAENVSHIYHMVQARDRYNALKRVVDFYPDIYGIVFCRTRQETKDIAASLMSDGYNAEALHGDLSQAQRDYVMQKFREKNLSVLVATDVAARGLDVNNLTHVINYNLPDDLEVYTHRSGRTGRAGKYGLTVSIINLREKHRVAQIERSLRKNIEQKPIPSGPEICKRQLFFMIEKMQNSVVAEEQIEPYMSKVYAMLENLSREEIIKGFVSQEFNRFLDYYKNAPDLNLKASDNRDRDSDKKRSKKGKSMSRVLFNVGKGKKISKRDVIDLITSVKGMSGVEIGVIEIFNRATAFEVEKKSVKQVISGLNSLAFKGINIEAEENYEFTGNDYRDRNKGPRGKKRR
jgi:ATP-dependent RNA helicase DeaD